MGVSPQSLRNAADFMKQASGVDPTWLRDAADEIARLRNELVLAKDALREFVEAYKHQDCAGYQEEMARAYSIADANLSGAYDQCADEARLRCET